MNGAEMGDAVQPFEPDSVNSDVGKLVATDIPSDRACPYRDKRFFCDRE